MSDRLERLYEALRVAERVGNTFLAANLRAAIQEESRLSGGSSTNPPHRPAPQ